MRYDSRANMAKDPPKREDWSHPRSRLPLERGSFPYHLPKRKRVPESPKGRRGYVDRDANVWEYAQDGTKGICEHWDLQYPDGDYRNIDPEGEIHHGGEG